MTSSSSSPSSPSASSSPDPIPGAVPAPVPGATPRFVVPIRAVVFDLDGTLVDAFADIAAAVNHGMKTLGLPEHSFERIKSFVGNGVPKLAERAVGAEHADLAPRLARLLVDYYRAHPADNARPYPGAVDMLMSLRAAGIRTAVLSNKRHELSALVIDRLGLAPYLDAVAGESHEVKPKPDPSGFLAVAARLGATPSETLMVGDGEPDATVARNAGAPFIGVSWGLLPAERLRELGALAILNDLRELPPILAKLEHS